jgi:hypothetical protein
MRPLCLDDRGQINAVESIWAWFSTPKRSILQRVVLSKRQQVDLHMKGLSGSYRARCGLHDEEGSAMFIRHLITKGKIGSLLAGLTVAVMLLCHGAAAFAQDRCWTMGGSTGTVDEADLNLVTLMEEFSFKGGKVKEGRVFIDPGVQVEVEPKSKVVFLKNTGGPGVEIDCLCAIEGEGFCFPVVDQGLGPVIVNCADACGFCVMDITETDGFRIRFTPFTVRP